MTVNMACNGKKVYVGMDVHKKTYSISAICDGVLIKSVTMAAQPEKLRSFFATHFFGAEIFAVYEAGFSGFHLQRSIESWGHHCSIVNPGSIEVSSRDRVKTDKRDSKKLAEHLFLGRIKGIRVPTEEEESRRFLTRTRAQYVEERSKIGVQIKSKLHQLGLMGYEDDRVMSKKYILEIEALKVHEAIAFVFKQMCLTWKSRDIVKCCG